MDRAATDDAAGGHAAQAPGCAADEEREVRAVELAALQRCWKGAYAIEFYGGVYPEEWVAYRRDGTGGRLSALSADGLGTVLAADQAGRTVTGMGAS